MKRSRLGATLGAVVAGALACSEAQEPPTPVASTPPAPSQPSKPTQPAEQATPPSNEELAARGRAVYMGNCIACHNPDPKQVGALGPELAGSSSELLEARVLHARYPEGYTPKRDTTQMVALPHLENDIDALAVFLAQ
ncbi:MAG: c-type cytochrome [Deltaproteobacteria bacterium]|nr:c-type cytochrome [Deltaproteobacteria bacterium]MBW2421077.1 c-type cytochrome [Deltaproteobacteria bacterium]